MHKKVSCTDGQNRKGSPLFWFPWINGLWIKSLQLHHVLSNLLETSHDQGRPLKTPAHIWLCSYCLLVDEPFTSCIVQFGPNICDTTFWTHMHGIVCSHSRNQEVSLADFYPISWIYMVKGALRVAGHMCLGSQETQGPRVLQGARALCSCLQLQLFIISPCSFISLCILWLNKTHLNMNTLIM